MSGGAASSAAEVFSTISREFLPSRRPGGGQRRCGQLRLPSPRRPVPRQNPSPGTAPDASGTSAPLQSHAERQAFAGCAAFLSRGDVLRRTLGRNLENRGSGEPPLEGKKYPGTTLPLSISPDGWHEVSAELPAGRLPGKDLTLIFYIDVNGGEAADWLLIDNLELYQ